VTDTPKAPRTARTPEQRAALALASEQRKVDRLSSKVKAIESARAKAMLKAKAELDALQPELAAAERRRDYLAKSPDLDAVAAHAKALKGDLAQVAIPTQPDGSS
jgi:hypothetical protein